MLCRMQISFIKLSCNLNCLRNIYQHIYGILYVAYISNFMFTRYICLLEYIILNTSICKESILISKYYLIDTKLSLLFKNKKI